MSAFPLIRALDRGTSIFLALLAAIAMGGDSLQLDSALQAASVKVLMALVLLGVFGWGGRKKAVPA